MTTVRVDGVKDTIKELRKIDPELRKTFNRNVKAIVQPVISAAQQKYRAEPYPSGTARKWTTKSGREMFPLDGNKAAKGTKFSIKTGNMNSSTILLVNTNAGAQVFEFASKGRLGEALRGKNGLPARTLWPAMNARLGDVIENMRELVDLITIEVNGRVAASGRLAK